MALDLDHIRERFLGVHQFAPTTPLAEEPTICTYCPAPAAAHPTDGFDLSLTPQQQIIADLIEEVEQLRANSTTRNT